METERQSRNRPRSKGSAGKAERFYILKVSRHAANSSAAGSKTELGGTRGVNTRRYNGGVSIGGGGGGGGGGGKKNQRQKETDHVCSGKAVQARQCELSGRKSTSSGGGTWSITE